MKKKVGIAIFISDKIDFKAKAATTVKGHYIAKKRAIQQEDIALVKETLCTQHRNP